MIILGNLIITIVAYMTFPLIMLAINKGRFPKKKAHKIALWNSIIVGTIFLIIAIVIYNAVGWTPTPAFLYYLFNRAIIEEKTTKQKNIVETNQMQSSQEINIIEGNFDTNNINFCRKCGNRVIKNSNFCNKCGSKISWI